MMSFCICTTIRARQQDTLAFVKYHLNIGITHIFLFFDDPNDSAIDVLSTESRVTCTRCDADYWARVVNTHQDNLSINDRQRLNTIQALSLARKLGFDWIAHIDGDELIYSNNSLQYELENIPTDTQIVKMNVLEAVPPSTSTRTIFDQVIYFKLARVTYPPLNFAVSLPEKLRFIFETLIYQAKCFILYGTGYADKFKFGFIKGHSMGKTIIRTTAPIEGIRSHYPVLKDGSRLKMLLYSQIFVLHFDCMDSDDWIRKWRFRLERSTPVKLGRNREKQFQAFISVQDKGELALQNLYSQIYDFSIENIKAFKLLGLIRSINLPSNLFE